MDGQAERCAHCGTPSLSGGRFCTNCGAQLGTEPTNPRVLSLTTDTAERVYDVPPVAQQAPPAHASSPPPPATAVRLSPGPAGPAYPGQNHRQHRPGVGLWIGAASVLVAVLVIGGFLLLHGGGDPGASSTPPIVPKPHPSSTSPAGPTSSAPSPSDTTATPSSSVKQPPTNVAGLARASAPRHGPAGVDFQGRPVTFVAANMVDERDDTCWRTPGDATGTVLTFRLDQPTRLSRVGLVNGYSKIAYSRGKSFDWYRGNRRVETVQWLFDDGSSVTQKLGFDRSLQQIPIKPVTTQVVRLRILEVSAPGHGRAARNDTAISEIFLLGRSG
ncbi:MAG: hypothetical protein QM747_18675 [Nocardioides sp.]